MTHYREFGPMPLHEGPGFFAPIHIVGADVARLQARGVHGPFRPFVYQTELVGTLEYGGEQFVHSPFFSSRCSA